MKLNLFIIAIVGSLCMTSCFGKIKDAKENLEDATGGLKNVNKAVKEMQKAGEDIKKLQEMEPLTNEDFKDWMPEEVNGMKRTGYKTGTTGMAGVASAEATYKNEDGSEEIKVNVIDGAGQMASLAIAGVRMATAIDMEEVDENGYKKTVKKDDLKALESYRNYNQSSEIMFLYDGRFAVTVNGKGMEADKVWKLLDELDLKKLSKKAS